MVSTILKYIIVCAVLTAVVANSDDCGESNKCLREQLHALQDSNSILQDRLSDLQDSNSILQDRHSSLQEIQTHSEAVTQIVTSMPDSVKQLMRTKAEETIVTRTQCSATGECEDSDLRPRSVGWNLNHDPKHPYVSRLQQHNI